jgi:hypothetical protein
MQPESETMAADSIAASGHRCDASADETSTAAADRRSIRADRVVLPSSLPTTGASAKPQVSLPDEYSAPTGELGVEYGSE